MTRKFEPRKGSQFRFFLRHVPTQPVQAPGPALKGHSTHVGYDRHKTVPEWLGLLNTILFLEVKKLFNFTIHLLKF